MESSGSPATASTYAGADASPYQVSHAPVHEGACPTDDGNDIRRFELLRSFSYVISCVILSNMLIGSAFIVLVQYVFPLWHQDE
ncbi:uncharacterized protein K460DRAFT_410716 [Cucurbitaria berberidis CBS 394.84]|uniref:Uncharacterized protein n=1 Tax=Cucurbitaria berberidis CBS 394.84 TaxID=1168544 RepID=A0A9P4G6U9_9PLEO|nr:uncharacterized protein K460DRAFT_410716 [Cucurbitaria berberidis CBS 394.84]KAF1840106.1 hypothetical protein K460DRAFT_410716 [Cucurbitaria berberidis CBS 394.84]